MLDAINDLDNSIPLIIDLDGTFIHTDSLYENLIDALFHSTGRLLRVVPKLIAGRARIKQSLAKVRPLDPANLPYRTEILELIRAARAAARRVYLVSAADQQIAESVGRHLGLFDGAKGSDGEVNLKGSNKLAWLRDTFPHGFIYAGDSAADLPIWYASKLAVLVGNGGRFAHRLRETGVPVATVGEEQHDSLRDWLAEFRLHQWSKNLLIFVPLVLGNIGGDTAAILKTAAAFFIVGLVASGTYVINDLADLKADRSHATKRFRAIAAGRIGVGEGLVASLLLIVVGFGFAVALNAAFAAALGCYLIVTLVYSFRLKRVALFDVAALAVLFTLRIGMGIFLNDLPVSPWILSFSAFFFFSMALAKRHVELMRAESQGNTRKIAGRGYMTSDWPLTLAFGVASALCSMIVMLLFVVEQGHLTGGYRHPGWLFAMPTCILLWTSRIWLLSHRRELDDDPVVFAIKDPPSYALGGVMLAALLLAV
ncbi:hypothetical protein CCR94_17500 [Rhodoblastus sphagnicola]|uniref:Prenyltransferase n=1 Tax=Rhodoblastus sphagnicola TaxID=333368 RepID=A0A2S6N1S7_9HYPH|nr:UbiA family prenyltransferase [Rhodoblastus sphagnicola]MBB4200762.1 4-hydroxybenzoate polyprenyltransferase/phosphoserine phosphatase [Rhodoblastus sphagnicola]PPQ28538.1 hypothetical protein CCR94_17500 [Rhodoblastus sphagnicola]